MIRRAFHLAAIAAVAAVIGLSPAAAQSGKSKRQVDVEADSMELFDDKSMAVFSGNVVARQGDTMLRATSVSVFYAKGQDGKTDVTRLEAKGGVNVTTPTQNVTGDWLKMNVRANTAVVGGNVTVKQGTSVVRGSQLNMDLNTNRSQITGGRVRGSFLPD